MVDLRVVSSIDSILFAPLHHKVVHVSNHLWYTVISLCIVVIIVVVLYTYCKKQYNNAFVITDALVLIIGISQFDDREAYLPGVKRCVNHLILIYGGTNIITMLSFAMRKRYLLNNEIFSDFLMIIWRK
eukprot:292767_1